ncbi:hypothetical protein [Reichenbachiella ulvae]|uniref:Uncharacterized protein n=1 Tax=Reichenbachiella ulvae TaxID=2980104 RepID=A0ABT3CW61_9BACT|nr:hypothetical protein [Reichenbachiella ulvae]MCV9387759.1 hypothetical protein [Reichenbachiella ulvae]
MENTPHLKTITHNLNSLLGGTLSKYKEMHCPELCLFQSINIYTRPPRLKFYFVDGNDEDYDLLQAAVRKFKGNLEWILRKNGQNYWVIEPLTAFNHHSNRKEIKVWELRDLIHLCDLAVEDIRPLTENIARNLGLL